MRKAEPISPTVPAVVNMPAWQCGWTWLGVVLLGLLLGVAYHNTLSVPFVLDDDDSILNNPSIQSWSTSLFPPPQSGATVSGRPLLNLSLAVNYHLNGTEVAGYHVGNLLIHFLASVCLFGLVRRTLSRLSPSEPMARATIWAGFVAALWALHPLQTESVTYIIQRAESLTGLCYLFTLYAFVRGVEGKSTGWLVGSWLACLAGMGAKEVMATVPVVVFLYDRTFFSGSFGGAWRERRNFYLALASCWLFLLALIFVSGARGDTVGHGGVAWWEYALTQSVGVVGYFLKAVFPTNLVFDYGIVVEKRVLVIAVSLLLVGTAVVVSAILQWRGRRVGFLGAAFFIILAPSSSVVAVATQTLAEHRMYLPLAAIAVGVVMLVRRFAGRAAFGLLSIMVVALIIGTVNRNRDYRSAQVLWEDTVAKVPYNTRALTCLAVEYLRAGKIDDALVCLSKASKNSQNEPSVRANYGLALLRKSLHQETDDSGQVKNDRVAQNLNGLPPADLALVNKGLGELRASVQLRPSNAPSLALILVERAGRALKNGYFEAAEIIYIEAVKLAPENTEALYYLGGMTAMAGRDAEAIGYYERLLRLVQPTAQQLANLGALYARNGQYREALERTQRALAIDPGYDAARQNLVRIQAALGKPE